MSDLPTAQRADSRCAAGRPNHDWSIQEKNKENPERKVVADLFRRRGFPTEKTYQDGAGFSLKEGGLLLLSAAKEKKEKKAIRHRGVGAPNKGMSRNGCRDSMGLIGPGKTMLRSGPLQGSGAPTSVRTAGLPSMGFLATFGAQRFPKGNEGKTQGGLPLGNPVCLWQTELFKLNLKSSPSSSGYNRRRRLAPRSSGKQQAERTSVWAAPIVCPEESPLLAASHDNSVIRETITGGMTRRLRRELGLVILWASRRLSVPEGFQRGTEGSACPVGTTAEGG